MVLTSLKIKRQTISFWSEFTQITGIGRIEIKQIRKSMDPMHKINAMKQIADKPVT